MPITALRPGRRGPAFGWSVSLLVHGLVGAWLLRAPVLQQDNGRHVARIDFVLVPPRVVVPVPVPVPSAPARPRKTERAAPRAVVAHVVDAVPALSADAPAVPAPAPADDTPSFDMAAARGIARAALREDGRGLVALPKRPPPTLDPTRESRDELLARGIARSRRSDCRTAYAGLSLLAVLPLLKDAVTGSGCKW